MGINPQELYTLKEFKQLTQLGDSSRRRARKSGNELPTLQYGRVRFVRGSDIIEHIEAMAAKQRDHVTPSRV